MNEMGTLYIFMYMFRKSRTRVKDAKDAKDAKDYYFLSYPLYSPTASLC